MKERPILFSGPMVRAILGGRKTQTRRLVKSKANGDIKTLKPTFASHVFTEDTGDRIVCPYGAPGDRLWVRETFGLRANWCLNDQKRWLNDESFRTSFPNRLRYRADAPEGIFCWRPSIHMPRWASRITLEIVSVRVERLNEISEEDAKGEGCRLHDWQMDNGEGPEDHREAFRLLWQSINGAESWHANPWVWVVEFRKLEGGAA